MTYSGLNNELEYTGVLTREGKPIFVGDTVDTVQGTVFKVSKVKDFFGNYTYTLFDGVKHWKLLPNMSPNLWLVNS